jgi:integrase
MARRESNLYKRSDGRYEGRYIKDRTVEGKAVYGYIYAKNYTMAKEKLAHAKLVNAGHYKDAPETVPDLLGKYLKLIQNHIKPSTYGLYHRYLTSYIAPYFGGMKGSRLTPETVQGFVDKKLTDGLSVKTVRAVFQFMKSGIVETVDNKLIHETFKNIRFPSRPAREIKVFSTDEQGRLEAAAKSAGGNNYIGVILSLYTGIRLGELCGLMWQDIDFECRVLHVNRTMQRISDDTDSDTKTKLIFLSPKSRTSARSIPLPVFLVSLLARHRQENGGLYVLSHDGKPIEPRAFQYRFKTLLKSAKLKPVNAHICRHTFSVRALENGFDVKTLSEILGHASAAVTLNVYAHSLDEHKRMRMESLSLLVQ